MRFLKRKAGPSKFAINSASLDNLCGLLRSVLFSSRGFSTALEEAGTHQKSVGTDTSKS